MSLSRIARPLLSGAAPAAAAARHAQTPPTLARILTEPHSSAAPKPVKGLFDLLSFGSKTPRVPLDIPYRGVPALSKHTPPVDLSVAAEISTLPNGVRVATLPSHAPIASVGVFVDGGSRYENAANNGITNFLENMALKSTEHRSDFRLVRDMQKIGAGVNVSSGREHLIYSADCLREHVPHVLGTLGDIIQYHMYDPQEIIEERERYAERSEAREKIADMKIMEAIHEAAYNGVGLGLSLYAPPHNVSHFDHWALSDFSYQLHHPKRMVVSGVGVEHAELVRLTTEVFQDLCDDLPEFEKVAAHYQGGEVRMHKRAGEGELTHFALAFETASWHHKDLVAMCVLQMIMGGGGSFSAGGPGKGMYSRLYSNVLNKYDWAESCTCFNSIHTDSSLFGIYGTCLPDKSHSLVDVVTKEVIRMTGPVDPTELARAKNQLRSAVYMQLESRVLKLEDIGRQVMTYGRVQTAKEISAQIDAVTPEDLQRVAKAMLATPVTLAASGDLTQMPRYEQIQRAFK